MVAWSLATLVFVAGLVTLGWQGYRTSLDLKGAATLDTAKRPDEPGYQAQIKPTTVQVMAHVTAADSLGDVQLLVQGSDGSGNTPAGAGGTVIFVPSVTVVVPRDGGAPTNLEKIYADQGFDAVVAAVSDILSVGVSSQTLLTRDEMVKLIEPAGTIAFDNPDTIYVTTAPGSRDILYASGRLELTAEQAVDYLDRYAEGENQIKRFSRAQVLWGAWLTALGSTPATPAAGAAASGDAASAVSLMAAGPHTLQAIPIESIAVPGSNGFSIFRPDAAEMPAFVAQAIPFPTSAYPGQRVRVRMVNGTKDTAAAIKNSPRAVAAGAEIVLIANAASFDVTTTRVEYGDPQMAEQAATVASGFGVAATKVGEVADAYDVTVVLGSDLAT